MESLYFFVLFRNYALAPSVTASEAKQTSLSVISLDCHVATLLAMTEKNGLYKKLKNFNRVSFAFFLSVPIRNS